MTVCRPSFVRAAPDFWVSCGRRTRIAMSLPDTFRPDNLHPVAKGYDIWGEAVQTKLAQLLK